jgi:ethanolamine utilization cobalamin adenosyltransferase
MKKLSGQVEELITTNKELVGDSVLQIKPELSKEMKAEFRNYVKEIKVNIKKISNIMEIIASDILDFGNICNVLVIFVNLEIHSDIAAGRWYMEPAHLVPAHCVSWHVFAFDCFAFEKIVSKFYLDKCRYKIVWRVCLCLSITQR